MQFKKVLNKVLLRAFNVLRALWKLAYNFTYFIVDSITKYLKYFDENTKIGRQIVADEEQFWEDMKTKNSVGVLLRYCFGLPALRVMIRLSVPIVSVILAMLLVIAFALCLKYLILFVKDVFEWVLAFGVLGLGILDHISEKQLFQNTQMQNLTNIEWESLAYNVVMPASKLPVEVLLTYSHVVLDGAYHFGMDIELDEEEVTTLRRKLERNLSKYCGLNLGVIRRNKMVEVTGLSILIRPCSGATQLQSGVGETTTRQ